MSEQSLCQQHANFLSTLQLAHQARVQFVGNIQPLQQQRGVGFGGVSVFLADDAFEFAQFHAVFIGDFRLHVNLVALLNGCPEPLIAHDYSVEHRKLIEGILILA